MRRGRTSLAFGGSGGSILLEVLVAALLVGLLAAPLATALAGMVGEARSLRQRVGGGQAGDAASQAAEGWEWGSRVIAGWWRPGPALHVRLSGAAGEGSTATEVGLWADGWLVADEVIPPSAQSGPPATDDVQMGPELWTELADSELVVRVRTPGGAWGPPWRLAVPESGGGNPGLGAALPAPAEGPTVVVHRPGVGTSSLNGSWSAAALTFPPFGLLFSLAPAIDGWGGATLDGRSQWWLLEEGRSVDLYF